MTTYVYETIPKKAGRPPLRFEVRQAMSEAPLKKHPRTGERVRRVIAGGYGFIAQKAAPPAAPCGCGRECESCDQN
jgi:predicted nucleic acid-binding Zn ribbon protein